MTADRDAVLTGRILVEGLSRLSPEELDLPVVLYHEWGDDVEQTAWAAHFHLTVFPCGDEVIQVCGFRPVAGAVLTGHPAPPGAVGVDPVASEPAQRR